MAQLKSHEKVIFERLFDRNGYVLNFTNKTFAEFFREHKINIDHSKYRFNGDSKMKRLRAFWEVEPDNVVGKVLEALLQYVCVVESVDEKDHLSAVEVTDRLLGKSSQNRKESTSEQDFLKQEFTSINWEFLKLDVQLERVLKHRIQEIQKTLNAQAALATIFLCGSTLEGLLLDAASRTSRQFNQANTAPKERNGTIKRFQNWTLNDLIDGAYEVGSLSLDVKKFSHSLRDFRNYIHPRQQAVEGFNPDMYTAKISWQVLQAAIADMSQQRQD